MNWTLSKRETSAPVRDEKTNYRLRKVFANLGFNKQDQLHNLGAHIGWKCGTPSWELIRFQDRNSRTWTEGEPFELGTLCDCSGHTHQAILPTRVLYPEYAKNPQRSIARGTNNPGLGQKSLLIAPPLLPGERGPWAAKGRSGHEGPGSWLALTSLLLWLPLLTRRAFSRLPWPLYRPPSSH